jgi:hypothetical protein
MNEAAVAAAIADFFEAIDLGLAETYPYPISNTSAGLPDVVVFVSDTVDAVEPPEEQFPGHDLQEAWWRVFQVLCSFMVEVEAQTEAAVKDAWAVVEGMTATIREEVGRDLTLGDRLGEGVICSPLLHFDFSEPFIAREDQTKGRHFNLEMVIAERIAAPGGSDFWPAS